MKIKNVTVVCLAAGNGDDGLIEGTTRICAAVVTLMADNNHHSIPFSNYLSMYIWVLYIPRYIQMSWMSG